MTAKDPCVLVVDDDPDLLKMIARICSEFAEVHTAGDGVEALRHLNTGLRPDLIITDLMMPNIDGLELARRLKQQPVTARIPVIMLTAKSTPRDVIAGINAGARSYLTKPFRHDELVEKAKKALRISS